VNYIRNEVFKKRYGYERSDFDDWCLCQTADSCSVNIKTARLLGFPHVPCGNHLLDHEVEELVDSTKDDEDGPGQICAKVHETMNKVKGSNKNSAALSKFTQLRPSLENPTKWTGRATMMDKWVKMRDPLIEAASHSQTTFTLDDSSKFKKAASNLSLLFKDINDITKSLQTRLYLLHEVWGDLNTLTAHAAVNRNNAESHWFQNKFSNKYIGKFSPKIPCPHFVKGVIKLQQKQFNLLSEEEIDAISKLRLPNADAAVGGTSLANKLENRRKRKFEDCDNRGGYINADFIVGSAAEVERCWSTARYLKTSQRAKMSPHLFEAIMMLRFNDRLWDNRTVMSAWDHTCHQNKEESILKRIQMNDKYLEEETNIFPEVEPGAEI
jgi:hypothetical protein